MKDIRKKISSTKNTQQITKAMKMVSAAKLRRAQMAIVSARPYANKIHTVISSLAASGDVTHPLLVRKENPKRILMVVLTSDRGLCGAFNSSIIRFTDRYYRENKDKYETIDFIFVGRRGADYFKKRNVKIVDSIVNLAGQISYDMAAALAQKVMDAFTEGQYDEVKMIYNEFKSAISQKVIAENLLPVTPITGEESFGGDYIFEPDPVEIVDRLIPKHFAIQVFRAMLESVASEHGARMSAMDGATRNAGQMMRKLTLSYNKLRQAAITKELMEIVSGAEALK